MAHSAETLELKLDQTSRCGADEQLGDCSEYERLRQSNILANRLAFNARFPGQPAESKQAKPRKKRSGTDAGLLESSGSVRKMTLRSSMRA